MSKLGIIGIIKIISLKDKKIIYNSENTIDDLFLERLSDNLSGDNITPFFISNFFNIDNEYGDSESSQFNKDGIAYRADSDYDYRSTVTGRIQAVNDYAVRFKGVFTAESDDMINGLYLGSQFDESSPNGVFNRPVAFLDKSLNKTEVIEGQPYQIEWEIVFFNSEDPY